MSAARDRWRGSFADVVGIAQEGTRGDPAPIRAAAVLGASDAALREAALQLELQGKALTTCANLGCSLTIFATSELLTVTRRELARRGLPIPSVVEQLAPPPPSPPEGWS